MLTRKALKHGLISINKKLAKRALTIEYDFSKLQTNPRSIVKFSMHLVFQWNICCNFCSIHFDISI